MLDFLEITATINNPGLIVLIDCEKAFDTISWIFLHKTLEYFNFGPIFRQNIKLLYTLLLSNVSNNGHSSEIFINSRGIRQGCPISSLLFILCAEILATNIRQSADIRGIKIGKEEIRLTQFADDTCLYLDGLIFLKMFSKSSKTSTDMLG